MTDAPEQMPKTLRVRDTKLKDDLGGMGQRIYTTAGAGYTKTQYTRSDIAPKVKPLVWYGVGSYGSIAAKPTEQNGYFIIKTKGDAYRVYGITGGSDGGTEYASLDEAKAAAQAHHDALILSALVTQETET